MTEPLLLMGLEREVLVLDLDHPIAQDKNVMIHGRLMTVAQLRDALVPKTRRVRQEAVAMKHLYEAIGAGDAKKTKHIFNRLQATVSETEIFERLEFHLLLNSFRALMDEV